MGRLAGLEQSWHALASAGGRRGAAVDVSQATSNKQQVAGSECLGRTSDNGDDKVGQVVGSSRWGWG